MRWQAARVWVALLAFVSLGVVAVVAVLWLGLRTAERGFCERVDGCSSRSSGTGLSALRPASAMPSLQPSPVVVPQSGFAVSLVGYMQLASSAPPSSPASSPDLSTVQPVQVYDGGQFEQEVVFGLAVLIFFGAATFVMRWKR